ncbi:hypothetical protein PAEVO_20650 [Paenibacillus sp. GM2FR]|uniref:hypothetical protein n=1 Tax=Paenibacillus lautus TaxID=1401 RepID=UPI000CC1FB82|nr:hypothetical protein [Paenibacillus lautus]MEC0256639.1 hypothetical protein [Paenibacillus lautus]MEC0310841.1 hypothetical protein [Paenibacillus lautus]PJN55344.1 hypothetical protein PAEVO_20650 [Paenibacillus sp. GM2FR]
MEQVRLNTRLVQALAVSSQHGASTDSSIHIGGSLREGLHPEGYVLQWDEEGLRIEYSQPPGLHREGEMESYLSEYVFKDASGEIGHFLMELGRYYHLENSSLDNGTYLTALLTRGLKSRERLEEELSLFLRIFAELNGTTVGSFQLDFQYHDMLEWLKKRKEQLARLDLQTPDADVITDEHDLRCIDIGG